MKLHLLLLLSFLALGSVHAQELVFLCVNKDGSREYKNTGDTRGCQKIEMEGVTVVPAPKRAMQTADAKPSAMPASFPRVDASRQKLLDEERRQILQTEMKTEEQKLMQLLKEFNGGAPVRQAGDQNDAQYRERVVLLKEDIHRAEKNIEALKREIGNLR